MNLSSNHSGLASADKLESINPTTPMATCKICGHSIIGRPTEVSAVVSVLNFGIGGNLPSGHRVSITLCTSCYATSDQGHRLQEGTLMLDEPMTWLVDSQRGVMRCQG